MQLDVVNVASNEAFFISDLFAERLMEILDVFDHETDVEFPDFDKNKARQDPVYQATYRSKINTILNIKSNVAGQIPAIKLKSNDGWILDKQECRTLELALEKLDTTNLDFTKEFSSTLSTFRIFVGMAARAEGLQID